MSFRDYTRRDTTTTSDTGNNNKEDATGVAAGNAAIAKTDLQANSEWDYKSILFSLYLFITAFFILRIGRELYVLLILGSSVIWLEEWQDTKLIYLASRGHCRHNR